MQESEKNELYMPSGVRMKKEFFRGFGADELKYTILAAFVFLIIDCIIFMLGVRDVAILFFVPGIGVAIVGMMQVKGELNLSPVDFIKLGIQFEKSQKYYPYIAKKEWENIE